jgi:hypothetical protein
VKDVNDTEALRQLRQQLQPFLNAKIIALFERIEGKLGAGETPVLDMPKKKLTKEQEHQQRVKNFL